MSDTKVSTFLAEHPKMTGVLFTTLLLLSQSGAVSAAQCASNNGP
ncbi:hypothetical protein ACFPYI_11830 [Halomarina salina]|uniref:Uncharacterized protein n=1 Tax=Halomarina salina TaxID=1872699 RepID=A0ABD5RNC0_9EURY|nr:hypothetical protein [Halomarina salina]